MTLISTHVDLEELGNGQFRNTINMKPVAFWESGSLRPALQSWVDSGDSDTPHIVSQSPLRVRTANDGMRRIFPIVGDDSSYFEIGAPYLKLSGVWTKVSLGTPSRSGKTITWTRPQTITTITHAIHYIKLEIELRNGFVPEDGMMAFPVSITGLTRSGTEIRKNGVPVMQLRPFVIYDAANETDIRPIAHQFANLSGQPYLLLTLPSLTGMTRPVIDPTLTLQPDATDGVDTYLQSDQATTNFGTGTIVAIGESNSAVGRVFRTLIKFDVSSIPPSATVSAATLSLFANLDRSSNARTARWFRQLRAWVESQATYNVYATATNWQTAGGFGALDCEQTDIGSLAFTATATLNQFYDWTLTPSAVQEWVSGAFANNGVLGKMDTESDDMYQFDASDSATAAQRPKLVVIYTLPAAGVPLFMASYRRRRG